MSLGTKPILDEVTFWALLKGLREAADEVWLDQFLRVRMKLGTTTFCPVTFLANILGDPPPTHTDDFEEAYQCLGMNEDFAWELWQCIEKQYPYNFHLRRKLLEVLELGEFGPPAHQSARREVVEGELVGDILDTSGQQGGDW